MASCNLSPNLLVGRESEPLFRHTLRLGQGGDVEHAEGVKHDLGGDMVEHMRGLVMCLSFHRGLHPQSNEGGQGLAMFFMARWRCATFFPEMPMCSSSSLSVVALEPCRCP